MHARALAQPTESPHARAEYRIPLGPRMSATVSGGGEAGPIPFMRATLPVGSPFGSPSGFGSGRVGSGRVESGRIGWDLPPRARAPLPPRCACARSVSPPADRPRPGRAACARSYARPVSASGARPAMPWLRAPGAEPARGPGRPVAEESSGAAAGRAAGRRWEPKAPSPPPSTHARIISKDGGPTMLWGHPCKQPL